MATDQQHRAVIESTRRYWEWVRDAVDAYGVSLGTRVPQLPPWEDLSPTSKGLVIKTTGDLIGVFLTSTVAYIPEVEFEGLL